MIDAMQLARNLNFVVELYKKNIVKKVNNNSKANEINNTFLFLL